MYIEYNTYERLLKFVAPAVRWLEKKSPERFGMPEGEHVPHPSAMTAKKNTLYNAIFSRFFSKITLDDNQLNELKISAQDSTIVYITKRLGHLEFAYFNHLLSKNDLPLAVYNNAITTRRWMKSIDYWKCIIQQTHEINKYGHIYDPMIFGDLDKMVANGNSVLINIPESALTDENLFLTGHLAALSSIIKAQKNSAKPIVLVPLQILWSRRPKRHKKNLADILFGEKESPGMMRKAVMFYRNYRTEARAVIGRPIPLTEIIKDYNLDHEDAARSIRIEILNALQIQKRKITGPPIRSRSWFIQRVMSDEDLDEKICTIAADMDKTVEDLRSMAERYIKEIAADMDYTYVELFVKLLDVTLCKIYEDFDVDIEGLKRAQELYAKQPIVFVPNHKSHTDYLILSQILYKNDMTIPHIAAGINLRFWPIGKIFRHCGAYFIRRSFKGNLLYKATFETYLKILLEEGYSQEFFIEGGRSRLGRLRQPKFGMLSMLSRAAEKGSIENISFIPVSLTYDRVMELGSLTAESEGKPKETERPSQILKLTKYIGHKKHKHGSIFIRFGNPVTMKAGTRGNDLERVAHDICREMNRNMVLTPTSLSAAAILSSAKRGITLNDFERKAEFLLNYFKHKGMEISHLFNGELHGILMAAVSKLSSDRLVNLKSGVVDTFISIDESKRPQLAFLKNGIAHAVMSIGVASLLIKNTKDGTIKKSKLVENFSEIRNILSYAFHFATKGTPEAHITKALNFLKALGAISVKSKENQNTEINTAKNGTWMLDAMQKMIIPYLETMYITSTHITKCNDLHISESDLVDDILTTGRDMLLLDRISYRESINKFDIVDCLRMMAQIGIITPDDKNDGKFSRGYTISSNNVQANNLKVILKELL